MKAKWLELKEKTAELSLRERGIIAATTVVVVLVVWLQFVFTPLDKKSQQVNKSITALNQDIANESSQIATLAASLQNNPNDALRKEQKQLKNKLSQLSENIEERLDTLVPPEKMADLMRDVLSDYKGLRLVSARNLPVEPIHIASGTGKKSDKETDSSAQAVIFSHGFEMKLNGGYFKALEFIQRLEQMQGFYWQMLDYEVDSYPNATITIQLSTLSLEEDWIGV